jgi:hypothetical protein
MIFDGYTRVLTCDEMTVLYRPLTHRTRREIFTLLGAVPATYGLPQIFCSTVASRIVQWDWREAPSVQVLMNIRDYHLPLFENLCKTVMGTGTSRTEQADAVNLAMGVRLKLLYPETAKLSCDECQKWWIDPLSGEYVMWGGKKTKRDTQFLLCNTRDGCPAGRPDQQRRLSPKNKLAYEHYLECEATGRFPDDCIVSKNAKIIRSAIERVKQECSRTSARMMPVRR